MFSFSPDFPAIRGALTRPLLRFGMGVSLASAVALLSACGSVSALPSAAGALVSAYKIDVVQGNVVTREQIQALQPGMSRRQVSDWLGSPLLSSVFHADRWDYVFSFSRQGQGAQQRRVTVFFKGEAMERFEADALPSEAEFVASLNVRRPPGGVPTLQATPDQLQRVQPVSTATPAAGTPASSYPPLETPASRP